ncbi:MAG: InlB B-repeat-containing protein, partial [Bifidobacteriaceae bacterium]|jgi:uncharacterized repeat protein (TIGR02543 family)|nr:InlB B-repeat-containing protein [Bifidobacteriaceae bacterium]
VTAADKAKVKDLDKVKNNPDRQSAIAWLVKNNISVLQKGDVYNPSGTVNRGAMAEFMQKLYQKVMIPDVGTIAADKTVTNPNTGTANKVLNKGYSYKVALSVVTFNSNAGSAVDKQIVETGKKVIKPKDPTKAGYEFDGWFQDAAFKTAFDFAKTTVTKDITLYAAWTKLWTVTFDPGEGTCESDCAPQLVRDGALATEPLIAPNRLDYDFKGWQILGAEKFPFDTTPIYNDITLHAIWEAKQLTLVETTYAYDETTLTETSVTYKFNIPVLEPASIPGQDYKVTLNAAGDEATVEFVPDYDVLVGPNEIPVIGFAAANNDKSFTTEVTVLYKVDGEGVRKATAGTGEVKLSEITDGFQVEFADADRPFAWVATEPSVKKWVHLGDTYILNIVRAIFLPNIDVIEYDADTPDLIVARALDLFHVKLVDDLLVDPVTNLPNTPDTIVVSGEKIPNVAIGNDTLAEVHVGAPGEFTIVDNSELPDFIIPPGKLGTSSVKYEHSRLVINAGAYIDVQSSQYFGSTPNLNEGLYHNGNVRVTNGAFLRESGYSDWPLGADSTYTVQIGGKMAVGPGNREGAYMQKTSKDNGKTFEYGTPTTNTEDCGADGYCHGFIGWLLGTEDDSLSSIQIGHIDRQSGAVDVAYGWVYITNYTYVKVAKYANIYPYNVLVGGGSTVEIAAKLDTEQGGIQAKFYGAVGTSISQGTVPATFPGSTITLTGEKASVSPIALGFNAGDDIKSGTFYAITPSSPVPATQSPWAGTTEYQNGWKEVE